jgi:uncharacterized protein (UPF0332 family)
VAAKPEDFLAEARKLLKVASSDIEYRNIVNNAYYAAFHAAKDFEEKLPHRSKHFAQGVGTHESLIQRLEKPDASLEYGLKIRSKEIGAQMRMLKPLRELAFYELDEPVRIETVEEAIEAAEDVLKEAKPRR